MRLRKEKKRQHKIRENSLHFKSSPHSQKFKRTLKKMRKIKEAETAEKEIHFITTCLYYYPKADL